MAAPDGPKILVVGSLNTDLVTRTRVVPMTGETRLASSFTMGCGGKGLNQAVACARTSRTRSSGSQGSPIKVSMIGAVGDDLYGEMLRKELRDNSIDDTHLQTYPGSSGVAVIIVEEDTGDNRILVTTGANKKVDLRQLRELVNDQVTRPSIMVLQLEVPVEVVIEAIELAKKHSIEVVLNPAPAIELPNPTIKDLDHLIMNLGEAALLAGLENKEPAVGDGILPLVFQKFHGLGVRNTVVTLGAGGVAYSTGNGEFAQIPAVKGVKVVDTTAAGDTFVGSYATSLAQMQFAREQFDIKHAAIRANQAAAKTVEKEGAIASIPWADELKQ